MGNVLVGFRYYTGLKTSIFRKARLRGSFDAAGRLSDSWSEFPMTSIIADDGCPAFETTMEFDVSGIGKVFHWGVVLDGSSDSAIWGIPTEVPNPWTIERTRAFKLDWTTPRQDYYLTYGRRLGARKHYHAEATLPHLLFAVWAPYARRVQVVYSARTRRYVGHPRWEQEL